MRILLFLALLSCSLLAEAQVLFTYDGKKVESGEFLRAFNKSRPANTRVTEQAMKEYLDLFIISRLKIQAALDMKLDTTAAIRLDLESLRSQMLPQYMNDAETIRQLVDEAFDRTQKDIRVAHIFIPFKGDDTAVAYQQIHAASKELSAGRKFGEVALKYSMDTLSARRGGELGYITAFSLPYEFENLVYGLKPNTNSRVYRSAFAYHIFRNMEERPAMGRMKAAQILLAFPPGMKADEKKQLGKLADSLYSVIRKGGDFTKLQFSFSNDYVANAAGGIMREFGVGQYDPLFERTVFALKENGAMTAPFATDHGYHIVQRISHTPVSKTRDENTLEQIRLKVETDPRIRVSKEKLYRKIIAAKKIEEEPVSREALFAYADSLIDFKRPTISTENINSKTLLLTLNGIRKTVDDYVNFAILNRFYEDGSGLKPSRLVYYEFLVETAMEYYKQHLEEFNEEFRNQMNDFRDGNLFFEIMMQKVWSPAQHDTKGLREFYSRNQEKFKWTRSADAVIFYCADTSSARLLQKSLQGKAGNWREEVQHYADRCTYDSARFELNRIPGLKNQVPREGSFTGFETNEMDKSLAFAYILKYYPNPAQKTFEQAMGDLTTAYQEELDQQWIGELKKKYPVKLNESEWKRILNTVK